MPRGQKMPPVRLSQGLRPSGHAVGFRRWTRRAEALRGWDIPLVREAEVPASPSATPRRKSASSRASPRKHVHLGAERFWSRVLQQPPCRRGVVVSVRLHLDSHSPSGTLKECVIRTTLLRARHALRFTQNPQAKAFWPPPVRSPDSQGAEAPWFSDSLGAVRARQGTRSGTSPGRAFPGARPRVCLLLVAETLRIRLRRGTRPRGRLPRRNASPFAPKRFGSGVCRSARYSGFAFTAASKRVGSGFPFAPRPRVQRIGFGRAAVS
jgi:hypothetical protein